MLFLLGIQIAQSGSFALEQLTQVLHSREIELTQRKHRNAGIRREIADLRQAQADLAVASNTWAAKADAYLAAHARLARYRYYAKAPNLDMHIVMAAENLLGEPLEGRSATAGLLGYLPPTPEVLALRERVDRYYVQQRISYLTHHPANQTYAQRYKACAALIRAYKSIYPLMPLDFEVLAAADSSMPAGVGYTGNGYEVSTRQQTLEGSLVDGRFELRVYTWVYPKRDPNDPDYEGVDLEDDLDPLPPFRAQIHALHVGEIIAPGEYPLLGRATVEVDPTFGGVGSTTPPLPMIQTVSPPDYHESSKLTVVSMAPDSICGLVQVTANQMPGVSWWLLFKLPR